jgi:hypothetical protein
VVAKPGDAPSGDRGLIEDAVTLLLSVAPAGWTHVQGEFEPSSLPPVAAVLVRTTKGRAQPLPVSAGVLSLLVEQQRSAAATGVPWRRLVIECHSDGRLSARVDNDHGQALTQSVPPDPQRWPRRLLAATTGGSLIAAAVVFAIGWQWSSPPRIAMIPVPPPPPHQQEAFDVINQWFTAENHSNVADMRAVACANPGPEVVKWFKSTEYYGADQAIVYPEAVTSFRDEGAQFKVEVAVRLHPLDDHMRHAVEIMQANGGYATDNFTLVDEGGHLKVCEMTYDPEGPMG